MFSFMHNLIMITNLIVLIWVMQTNGGLDIKNRGSTSSQGPKPHANELKSMN